MHKDLQNEIEALKSSIEQLKGQSDLDPLSSLSGLEALNASIWKKFSRDDVWLDPEGERWEQLDPLSDRIERIISRIKQKLPAFAKTRPSKLQEIRDTLLSSYPKRYDLVAQLSDDTSYKIVKDAFLANLECDSEDTEPLIAQAYVEFLNHERYGREVAGLICDACETLINQGIKKQRRVNDSFVNAMASALAPLAELRFYDALLYAYTYASSNTAHYELNKVSGTLAIALATMKGVGATPLIEAFIECFEPHYQGDDFVMQNKYALWLLTEDYASALAYLSDLNNTQGLGYAAAALADLNCREALACLEARALELTHVVTTEVFNEAIARLKHQQHTPCAKERMIWLFGSRTSSEIALGFETDNQFIIRAQLQSANSVKEQSEADDSSAEDIAVFKNWASPP